MISRRRRLLDALEVACPYCKADVNQPCRTKSGRTMQPSHKKGGVHEVRRAMYQLLNTHLARSATVPCASCDEAPQMEPTTDGLKCPQCGASEPLR